MSTKPDSRIGILREHSLKLLQLLHPHQGFNGVYMPNMFGEAINLSPTVNMVLSEYTNMQVDWQTGLVRQIDQNTYYREIDCISKNTGQRMVKISVRVTKEDDSYHITGYYMINALNNVPFPIDECVIVNKKAGYRV